jgi:hypothetical protein
MGFFGRTSKRSGRVRLGALAMAAAIALGCNYFDEGDSAGNTSSLLEGTWRGPLRGASDESDWWDDPACPAEPPCTRDLGFDFDAAGLISDVLFYDDVRGEYVSTGDTGTAIVNPGGLTAQFARFYLFELVDAGGAPVANGSFYTDERFDGGIFIFDDSFDDGYGDFAVMQKWFGNPRTQTYEGMQRKRTSTFQLGVFVRWSAVSEIAEVGRWEFETRFVGDGGGDEILYSGMIGGDVINRPDGRDNTIALEGGIPLAGEFDSTKFDTKGVWETAALNPLVAIRSYHRKDDKALFGTMECENGFPDCVFSVWSPIIAVPPRDP